MTNRQRLYDLRDKMSFYQSLLIFAPGLVLFGWIPGLAIADLASRASSLYLKVPGFIFGIALVFAVVVGIPLYFLYKYDTAKTEYEKELKECL